MRCPDARLEWMMTADDSSAEYIALASHVDECRRCQQRLLQLSSDDHLQVELRAVLRDTSNSDVSAGVMGSSARILVDASYGDAGAECEPIALDFLAAPSHPEMLGRIGRYDVERVIGSGGMGVVLKGFDTELHRVVAIKVLKPHLATNGAARRRFAREAQSAAAVVHEHVIPIYDVQSDGDTPFLVMQFVSGQSLQARVDERGPLDPRDVLRIARQIAAGLAAAHDQGLVHRDVKPANILLEASVERVLISDFGLARTADDASLTRTGIVAGTPHYMSPEQASGQVIDARSDLFSLGSVLYFMCTGRPPFRAEQTLAILNRICSEQQRPVESINEDVPPELAELIDRLLEKDPHKRLASAHDVVRAIESIQTRFAKGGRSRRLRWRRLWQRSRTTLQQMSRWAQIAGLCFVAGLCFAVGAFLRDSAWTNRPADAVSQRSRSQELPLSPQSTADTFVDDDAETGVARPDRTAFNFQRELLKTTRLLDDVEQLWFDRSTPESDLWYRHLEQVQSSLSSLEGQSAGDRPSP